jgi:hypothetical protein
MIESCSLFWWEHKVTVGRGASELAESKSQDFSSYDFGFTTWNGLSVQRTAAESEVETEKAALGAPTGERLGCWWAKGSERSRSLGRSPSRGGGIRRRSPPGCLRESGRHHDDARS